MICVNVRVQCMLQHHDILHFCPCSRSVATAKTIQMAKEAYIEVGCSPIDGSNNKKLVHFSCPLSHYASFTGVEGTRRGLFDSRIQLSCSLTLCPFVRFQALPIAAI